MTTETLNDAPIEKSNRALMGERVRDIRRLKNLRLQDVAARSGLAVSTVSKIERGVMAPTYDRFSRLAEGLGVDIAELFQAEGDTFSPGEVAIARAGESSTYETATYTYEMLFPELRGKSMVPMLGPLRPREEMKIDGFISHTGEEFLMVLEGQVTVNLEGRDPVVLETGDSIYFDSRRGHLYESSGTSAARILVVCTKLAADSKRLPAGTD